MPSRVTLPDAIILGYDANGKPIRPTPELQRLLRILIDRVNSHDDTLTTSAETLADHETRLDALEAP